MLVSGLLNVEASHMPDHLRLYDTAVNAGNSTAGTLPSIMR
jgi:hypothetical protein